MQGPDNTIQPPTPSSPEPRLSRRAILTGSIAAGAAVATGALRPGRLVAQDMATAVPATPGAGSATPISGGATPTADGVYISSIPGVPNAYTKMPTPFVSYNGVPGKGGKVAMSTISYSPPPTDKSQNTFWQALEQKLGVEWDANLIPASSYGEKMTALIAGGDLPDLTYLLSTSTAPVVSQSLQQGAFTDLTDKLSGDALAAYPNLALIPDQLWQGSKLAGKIYGVPKPVLRSNDIAFYRSDWAEKLGMPNPQSAEEYFDIFVAMAKGDPDGNGKPDTWALAGYNGGWNMFLFKEMFGTPYGWRLNDDGTLTNEIETDEFRQAVDFAARLYAAGAYYPDTASLTLDQELDAYKSGKIALYDGGFASFYGAGGLIDSIVKANPNAKLSALIPVGPGGKAGVSFAGQGYFGMVGIPASIGKDGDRTEELLQILDYLTAPFGSEENNFLRYGLPEDHDTSPDGSFVKNDKGRADMSALVYPFLSENFFFYPGFPNDALAAQQLNEKMTRISVTNPTAGIISQTAIQQSAVLSQLGTDRLGAIITGRASIDTLSQYVEDWKSRGGDQIRQELQEGIKAQQGG